MECVKLIRPETPLELKIAFQGGGAKIFALLAAAEVIREYEDSKKIKVIELSGTSAGAVVAVMYAACVSLTTVKRKFINFPLEKLFGGKSNSFCCNKLILSLSKLKWVAPIIKKFKYARILNRLNKGKTLANQQIIIDLFSELLAEGEKTKGKRNPTFGDLNPTKAYVIASDLNTHSTKIYHTEKDRLLEALGASTAIPFIFTLVNDINFKYVDGGFSSNLPADVFVSDGSAHLQGDKPILAVSFKSEDQTSADESPHVIKVLESILSTSMESGVKRAQEQSGVEVVELGTGNISALNFKEAQDVLRAKDNPLYEEARKDTRIALDRILNEAPPQFKAAEFRYRSIEHEIGRNTNPAKRYQAIWVEYTDIPEIEQIQEEIITELDSIVGDNWTLENFEVGESSGERFDAIQRPEIAIANEVIYLFPFFLSYLRTISWGVIPYAKQIVVGVLIHKEHQAYGNLIKSKASLDLEDYTQKDEDGMEALVDRNWIVNLLSETSPNGALWALKGYLFHELMPLMIRRAGNDAAQSKFLQIGKIVDKDIGNQKKVENQIDLNCYRPTAQLLSIPNSMFDKNAFKSEAMIVDLAHRNIIARYKDGSHESGKTLDAGYKLIPLLHGLDIDVGIGFSLSASPLLGGDNWKLIRNRYVAKLKSVKSELLQVGILLDNY